MNREHFIQNMIDQIKEAQLKLGYAWETVRLYYPVSSLNDLLETAVQDSGEMLTLLQKSFSQAGTLGFLRFSVHADRIEVSIPPEGAKWVHEQVQTPPFLKELITLFQEKHACTLEEICAVFCKYDPHYCCEAMPEGSDFDYAVYFSDAEQDAYVYCIHMEMGHTIYHRFTRTDFEALKAVV